jgi:hypothetical protein
MTIATPWRLVGVTQVSIASLLRRGAPTFGFPRRKNMDMLVVLILLLVLFGGGGGLYWGMGMGMGWGIGPVGLILLVLIISGLLFGYRGRRGN